MPSQLSGAQQLLTIPSNGGQSQQILTLPITNAAGQQQILTIPVTLAQGAGGIQFLIPTGTGGQFLSPANLANLAAMPSQVSPFSIHLGSYGQEIVRLVTIGHSVILSDRVEICAVRTLRTGQSTVRAPVFGRHQFFGTSEHYGKAHGSLLY